MIGGYYQSVLWKRVYALNFTGSESRSTSATGWLNYLNLDIQVDFRVTNHTGLRPLVGNFRASGAAEGGFLIYVDNGALKAIFYGNSSNYARCDTGVPVGMGWHRLRFLITPNAAELYLDGVKVDERTWSGVVPQNQRPFSVGTYPGTTNYLIGMLKNIAIYTGNMPLGIWPLNNSVNDISGNGRHLVNGGAIGFVLV
jgi:hypothetical protein